jgi:hypothetical protein
MVCVCVCLYRSYMRGCLSVLVDGAFADYYYYYCVDPQVQKERHSPSLTCSPQQGLVITCKPKHVTARQGHVCLPGCKLNAPKTKTGLPSPCISAMRNGLEIAPAIPLESCSLAGQLAHAIEEMQLKGEREKHYCVAERKWPRGWFDEWACEDVSTLIYLLC